MYRGELPKREQWEYEYTLKFTEGEALPFYLISSRFGNVSRFINHSADDPTCRLDIFRVDPAEPRVVIISRRAIAVGEEITFDYGGG